MGIKPGDVQAIDKTLTRSHFNVNEQIGTSQQDVLGFVQSFIQFTHPSEFSFELLHQIESPRALHYTYQQTYQGIKVYRGQVKVNLNKQGYILSVFDNTREVEKASEDFPSQSTIEATINNLYPNKEILLIAESELTWFWDGEYFIPSTRIEFTDKNDQYYEIIIDHTGHAIYKRDLLSYHHAAALDTPAAAKVFIPDPLTTAQVTYGNPYEDSNDADISQLNFQRQEVTIDADFQNGDFTLSGQYCIISEHSAPTVQPASKTSPDFDFTRTEDGFEDVNAFYHITEYQKYIQLLGFTNLAAFAIKVDCHALNGSDNSNFSPSPSPRLNFGEGGVDDAEDADVIIHEYGHALSYSGSPNSNSGTERLALDEGLGDYFCASYSRHINPFNWQDVFSWDGHNEYWSGRSVVTTKHYPENLGQGIHLDGGIWSATLMQIWEDIGREPTDAIQLQSLYSYANNMSMQDAAYVFLQANELYFGGTHAWPIVFHMVNRGLLPADVSVNNEASNKNTMLLNSAGFATGTGDAMLLFPTLSTATIKVYDISGKLVFNQQAQSNSYALHSSDFKPGMYIISVEQNGILQNFKLLKH